MAHRKLKRFASFMEQEGGGTGMPTGAPSNTVGGGKIAGLGSDIPPVPAKKRFNILKRKTAKLLNNKVIEHKTLEKE